MKIYCISGLGADRRVFKNLKLEAELIFVDWIIPKKKEHISSYASRLATVINQDEEFGLLGVSFGGLIAVEMNKVLIPKFTILISSVETAKEFPRMYRLFGKTRIQSVLPRFFFDIPRPIAYYLFGTNNKELLKSILDDTDLNFTKWAINALLTWRNTKRISNCIKIHGTNDRLIPLKNKTNSIRINEGAHLMILDNADAISKIINAEISDL